jgi:hypothetical protein
MENNNLILLADLSFEGKNYADSYSKYTQIVESDMNNLDGWIGKGLSAGFLANAEKNTLNEVSTILNHLSKNTLSDSQNKKIADNIIIMVRDYISVLVKYTKDQLNIKKNKPMATGELYAVRSVSDTADRYEVNNTICDNVIIALEFSTKSSNYNTSVETKKEQINLIDKFLSEINNEIHRDHKAKVLDIRTRIAEEVKKEDPNFVTAAPQKSDGCYIATHIYGDYDNESVIILRNFRDSVLRKTFIGMYIVKIYYIFSPKLVNALQNKRVANNFIKVYLLNPFVKFLK